MNFDFLNVPKSFFMSIYKKVEATACKANMTVKDYLSKPASRDHISLVVYDILPLPIKLSLRYERFKGFFDENYEKFVVKMMAIKMYSETESTIADKHVNQKSEAVTKSKPAMKKGSKPVFAKEVKSTKTSAPAKKKPASTSGASNKSQAVVSKTSKAKVEPNKKASVSAAPVAKSSRSRKASA